MNLIVAADNNLAIGNEGKLLTSIPGDMRFFRQMTMGNVVVMGRKTLESFPNQRPLKDRTNIVLTTRRNYHPEGAVVVHNLDELKEELKKYKDKDIFVIGGGKIYEELLALCDTAYVTRIDEEYRADTWFPNLDADPDWELTQCSEEQTYYDIIYYFLTYRRRNR